jgi:hypothetical protein
MPRKRGIIPKIILPENPIVHDFDAVAGVPVAVVIKAGGLFEDAGASQFRGGFLGHGRRLAKCGGGVNSSESCGEKCDAGKFNGKWQHKICPGFNNFVPEFRIDGKRFGGMLSARFVEHFYIF